MQELANGVIQGSVFALAATGLSLIFGVVRVPHFAHGEAVMLGGMFTLLLSNGRGWPLALALVAGMAAAVVFGVIVQTFIYYPMRFRDETNLLICALALVLIVPATGYFIWGADPQVIPNTLDRTFTILGAHITVMKAIIIGVSLVLTVGLILFTGHTRAGQAMKAMALNPYAARLVGIPTRTYAMLAFVIGSALAGLAGGLLGTIQPVQVDMGANLVLKSFIIVIFAGMGSIGGAWAGGLLLGLVEAFGGSYLSSAWVSSYSFIFLLVVLLLRPQGLFSLAQARD